MLLTDEIKIIMNLVVYFPCKTITFSAWFLWFMRRLICKSAGSRYPVNLWYTMKFFPQVHSIPLIVSVGKLGHDEAGYILKDQGSLMTSQVLQLRIAWIGEPPKFNDRSINQLSINQSINQTSSQSRSQSVNQSISQSVSQSISQSVSQPVSQSIN